MRPRSMDGLRVISCPSCQADSFQEANRGVGSFLFSTADRETIVHTHSWVHVCVALLFPNIERSAAYALAISCSAGLTCSRPGGIWVVIGCDILRTQLSTGVLFAEAQVHSSVFYFPWELPVITWIIKGFPGAPSSLFLTVKAVRATSIATFENVLLTAALRGIWKISYSWT